jgi:hypothetical protein
VTNKICLTDTIIGKRIEIVFEYLPDDITPAEAFYKFKLPMVKLEQLFLFAGKVKEPRVFFCNPRIDYHAGIYC